MTCLTSVTERVDLKKDLHGKRRCLDISAKKGWILMYRERQERKIRDAGETFGD